MFSIIGDNGYFGWSGTVEEVANVSPEFIVDSLPPEDMKNPKWENNQWVDGTVHEDKAVIDERQRRAKFRAVRDALIIEADNEISKLVDNNLDVVTWRNYRQALRDSTLTWVLPVKP